MVKARLKELTVEEFANTITHGVGLLLSLCGLCVLVTIAVVFGDIWYIASSIVYGLSLVVLYAASTLYHSATSEEEKHVLQVVDHCCIYLLIAGSYTPFTLIVLRSGIGLGLFAFVWAFAIIGVLSKVFFRKRFKSASVLSYLVMGWVGLIAVEPLMAKLGFPAIALIVLGGIAYSLGVIFYAWHSLRHHHAIWHVFVMSGSFLHFLAIAIYVIPFGS
jgi:hemolysin III